MQNKTRVKKILLVGDDTGPKAQFMRQQLKTKPIRSTVLDPVYCSTHARSGDKLRFICLDPSDFDGQGTMASQHYFPNHSALVLCPKDQRDLDEILQLTKKYRDNESTMLLLPAGHDLIFPECLNVMLIPMKEGRLAFSDDTIYRILERVKTPASQMLFDRPVSAQREHHQYAVPDSGSDTDVSKGFCTVQ